MRQRLGDDIKTAMKSGDKTRLATLRLISAAFKQADIDAEMAGRSVLDDAGLVGVLTKMVKQRRDSIQQFTAGGRPELAAIEAAEITVIEHYLPRQLSADEVTAALKAAITETGAESIKDMGKVMAIMKDRFAGQIDAAAVSARAKELLK